MFRHEETDRQQVYSLLRYRSGDETLHVEITDGVGKGDGGTLRKPSYGTLGRRRNRSAPLRKCHVAVIVFDVSDRQSFDDVIALRKQVVSDTKWFVTSFHHQSRASGF